MKSLPQTIASIALMFMSVTAVAEEVILKCVTAEGTQTEDIVVDLEAKEMRFGIIRYTILNVTPDYITAFTDQTYGKVGGDIWLLHRATGRYWRGAVGEYCTDEKCTATRPAAHTYTGTCRKNML